MKRSICFLGNLFEHFDSALYGLIAPLIAHVFYPNVSLTTGLIFLFLPYGLILRPLGALYLGYIGDMKGVHIAYKVSLIGTGMSAIAIAMIPDYQAVGIVAPICLGLCRGLQSFFNAGQRSGATLILLKDVQAKSFISSLYETSGMLGYILATICAIFLALFEGVSWRMFFIIGGVCCLICSTLPLEKLIIKKDKQVPYYWVKPFFAVAMVTGFSYANYTIAQTLMTVYMPIVSALKYVQMLYIYIALSCIDALLLPVFGKLAHKIGKEKQMCIALIGVLSSLPIAYYSFIYPTLIIVTIARFLLVLFGIMLAAPFQHWAQDHTRGPHQYRIMSLSKAIGAHGIGVPTIAISLWLESHFHLKAACVYYLLFITLLSLISVIYTLTRKIQRSSYV